MSDKASSLDNIDEETRERISAEAAAQNMSVPDYLTNALISRLMQDRPPSPKRDDLAEFRTRITALERRMSLSFSSLEGAIAAIDGVIAETAGELTKRIDHTQADTEEQAGAIESALSVMRVSIDALAGRIAKSETKSEERARAIETAAEEKATQIGDTIGALELRLDGAEAVAERESAVAEQAIDQMRVGLAECALRLESAQTSAERRAHAVDSALGVLRAAIDELELRVDGQAGATNSVLYQLRSAVDGLDRRLDETAEELSASQRAQMAAAEAMRQHAALSEQRLREVERGADAQAVALTATIADAVASAESTAQRAAEEAGAAAERMLADVLSARETFTDALAAHSQKLRGEMDVLANDIVARTKLMQERGDRLIETAEMRIVAREEAAAGAAAKLEARVEQRCVDLRDEVMLFVAEHENRAMAATEELAEDFSEMRERHAGAMARLSLVENELGRVAAESNGVRAVFEARLSEARAASDERFEAVDNRFADLGEHIEVSHLGVAADIARIDGAFADLADALAGQEAQNRAQFEAARENFQTQHDDMRAWASEIDRKLDDHSSALEAAEQAAAALAERVVQAEAARGAEREKLDEVLFGLEQRIVATETAVAASHRMVAKIDDIKSRVAVQEQESADGANRVSELAHALGALAAQQGGTGQRVEARVHDLEVALGDLRLQRFADVEADNIANEFALMEQRLAQLEQTVAAEQLDALRRAVEERMLAVESKNVRMLQHLNETIAQLAKKWDAPAPDRIARAG
ncbi:MAG TPA: hypothetical protein VG841_13160 [Caulobacterales bacterium]|nr:hypothetical protein [Caulobacterales bacterium]